MTDNTKIADLQARLTALAAELAALTDQPEGDGGVVIRNLAEGSERLAATKPVPHNADDARAEIARRFPASASTPAVDNTDEDVEPPRATGREAGRLEAQRRFPRG